jgi:hypothetical protein
MKNLILIAVALFFSTNLLMAQSVRTKTQPIKGNQPKQIPVKAVSSKPASAENQQEATPSKAVAKPDTKAGNAAATNESKGNPRQTSPVLKKDGTPDKRYKENQKLKKDGTPDMRYKENKPAEKGK